MRRPVLGHGDEPGAHLHGLDEGKVQEHHRDGVGDEPDGGDGGEEYQDQDHVPRNRSERDGEAERGEEDRDEEGLAKVAHLLQDRLRLLGPGDEDTDEHVPEVGGHPDGLRHRRGGEREDQDEGDQDLVETEHLEEVEEPVDERGADPAHHGKGPDDHEGELEHRFDGELAVLEDVCHRGDEEELDDSVHDLEPDNRLPLLARDPVDGEERPRRDRRGGAEDSRPDDQGLVHREVEEREEGDQEGIDDHRRDRLGEDQLLDLPFDRGEVDRDHGKEDHEHDPELGHELDRLGPREVHVERGALEVHEDRPHDDPCKELSGEGGLA